MSKDMQKRSRLRGAAYVRVSTKTQVEEGDSLPQQLNRCKAKCVELGKIHGVQYTLSYKLMDEGLSGKNTRRPGYQKLMELIEGGKINFLIATELSRLSRSLLDFVQLGQKCDDRDIRMFIIHENIDTFNEQSMFHGKLFALLAEYERKITGARVKENARARFINEGRINGASAILGLNRDPKKKGHFVVDKREASTITAIFDTYLKEQSSGATVRILGEKGIKNKNGKEFDTTSLIRLLRNHRLSGRYPVDREKGRSSELVELPHGPVVEIKKWEAVNKLLDRNFETRRRTVTKRFYPLTGLLENESGVRLRGESAKKGRHCYYVTNKTKPRIRIPAKQTEIIVRNFLMQGAPSILKKLKKTISEEQRRRENRLPTIRKEISVQEKVLCRKNDKLDKWLQRIESSDGLLSLKNRGFFEDSVEILMDEISVTRATLDELRRQERDLREKLQITIDKETKLRMKRLENIEGKEFRSLVDHLFEKLIVCKPSENNTKILGVLNSRHYGKSKPIPVGNIGSLKESVDGADGTRTRGLRRDRPAL
jgi:DNA invertase Pin-like site-specific DNA recombinase